MRPWRVKMPSQNLLRLLLLLMLVMRIVLATVCCRSGRPGLVISLNFCSDFEHFCQDFEVEVRRDFEAEVRSVFCCWCLVEVTKLNLGQWSEARFGQDLNLRFSRCLVEILKLMLSRDSEVVIFSICLWTVYCDLVIWTQPSDPLCLWQCFIFTDRLLFQSNCWHLSCKFVHLMCNF